MTLAIPVGVGLTAAAGAGLMMFAKGSGARIGHNQHENKQFRQAMKKLGIDRKDPRWRIAHDAMDGSITNFNELIEYIKSILGIR